MGVFQRGKVWWFKFYFAGREIKESSKSRSKTVAKEAEKQRRRELEEGFHNLSNVREQRIRPTNEAKTGLDTETLFTQLAEAFGPSEIKWRVTHTSHDGTRGAVSRPGFLHFPTGRFRRLIQQ